MLVVGWSTIAIERDLEVLVAGLSDRHVIGAAFYGV